MSNEKDKKALDELFYKPSKQEKGTKEIQVPKQSKEYLPVTFRVSVELNDKVRDCHYALVLRRGDLSYTLTDFWKEAAELLIKKTNAKEAITPRPDSVRKNERTVGRGAQKRNRYRNYEE